MNAQQWTTERPTEPGEYWLSLPPKQRTMPAVSAVVIDKSMFVSIIEKDGGQSWVGYVSHQIFNGAKWSRRETPADPFEVTE